MRCRCRWLYTASLHKIFLIWRFRMCPPYPLYDFTFPRHLIMCGYIILEDFKMDKYVLDNNNGLPCLTLSPEEEKPIGIWGQRHKRYLQEHRKATYTTLLTSGMLMLILPTSTNRAGTLWRARRANEAGAGYYGTAKGWQYFKMGWTAQ